MTAPEPARKPGARVSAPLTAEARQVKLRTWAALLVITTVVAVAVLADTDAGPVLSGALVMSPVLELVIFAIWWRTAGGRPG
ncbi:MAG: hypothetical protein JWP33_839 [Blastococcus sp.]|jgi:hypothetical protein|nr:hypothetical protein [Blastococcus sp.]